MDRRERRPDLVLYLNGIAVGVIELKRSSVEIGDGVRQLITNQEEIFNKGFFATVQLVFAGSDSQGLRYGTVTTKEEFFVDWKGQLYRVSDEPVKADFVGLPDQPKPPVQADDQNSKSGPPRRDVSARPKKMARN